MTADDSRHASSRSALLPLPDHAVHHVGRNHSRRPGRRQLAVLEGAGLRPDSDLLEVGCGVGRLVYELADVMTAGTYCGFDVSAEAIAWLNENYRPMLANFRFDRVDARNARYADRGAIDPAQVRFPYEDDAFDLACAFSVFTHMQLPEIERYLSELRRVVRPDGRIVVTVFAFGIDDSDPWLDDGRPFVPMGDGVWTIEPELPERGVGFDRSLIDAVIDGAGLEVVASLEGGWHHRGADRQGAALGQDALVLAPTRDG